MCVPKDHYSQAVCDFGTTTIHTALWLVGGFCCFSKLQTWVVMVLANSSLNQQFLLRRLRSRLAKIPFLYLFSYFSVSTCSLSEDIISLLLTQAQNSQEKKKSVSLKLTSNYQTWTSVPYYLQICSELVDGTALSQQEGSVRASSVMNCQPVAIFRLPRKDWWRKKFFILHFEYINNFNFSFSDTHTKYSSFQFIIVNHFC